MMLPSRYVLPVFLLIVFLGPVVLAPILNLALEPFGIPFHRVMSRALLFSALGALIIFRRHLHLGRWWPLGHIAFRQMARGFLLALISSLAMILFYFISCGFQAAEIPFRRAALSIFVALIAALIVPTLEETIFRGFLITILVATTGRWAGWFLAALIFSVAHFLRVPPGTAGPVHWWSGATGMLSIFTNLAHGDFLTGRGLNLFLAGLVLGGIFLRSGTLWTTAALHSGWIFILMSFTALTRSLNPPRVPGFGRDLLSSPLTSAVLLVLGICLWRFYRVRPEETRGSAEVRRLS
jgi:membrane protease YdiL (CAAX protease family)